MTGRSPLVIPHRKLIDKHAAAQIVFRIPSGRSANRGHRQILRGGAACRGCLDAQCGRPVAGFSRQARALSRGRRGGQRLGHDRAHRHHGALARARPAGRRRQSSRRDRHHRRGSRRESARRRLHSPADQLGARRGDEHLPQLAVQPPARLRAGHPARGGAAGRRGASVGCREIHDGPRQSRPVEAGCAEIRFRGQRQLDAPCGRAVHCAMRRRDAPRAVPRRRPRNHGRDFRGDAGLLRAGGGGARWP